MAWHYVTTDRTGWASVYGTEQTDNATEIWNILNSAYWSDNAKAAVLGNLQAESYINPGQWELNKNYDTDYGMGLGQWTPATKVSDYYNTFHPLAPIDPETPTGRTVMADGSMQMDLLLNTPGQYTTRYLNPDGSSNYYHETGLPYISTMYAFSQSQESIEDLTRLWAICWERPGSIYYQRSIGDRINHSIHWYNTLSGLPPIPPTPPTPPTPPIEYIMTLCKKTKRWLNYLK